MLELGLLSAHRYDDSTQAGKLAGAELADGFIAPLICLMGDLEFHSNHLQMPRWNVNSNCCSLCQAAGKGPLTFRNFQSDAPWMGTLWAPNTWREWPQRSQAVIFQLPHLSCWNICQDYMHAKFLGVDQYQYGSVMWLIINQLMEGDANTNLLQLWPFIQKIYVAENISNRYRFLGKVSMIMRKNQCKMRGKASEIKGFGKVVLRLWQEFMNESLTTHRQIFAMLKLNCRMEALMEENKYNDFFDDRSATQLYHDCQHMAHLQCLLHEHFAQEDGLPGMFTISAKLHALQHITALSGCISPALTWCFAGEDYMNVCKVLCAQCCFGVQPAYAPSKMVEHFRLGMHYQLSAMP